MVAVYTSIDEVEQLVSNETIESNLSSGTTYFTPRRVAEALKLELAQDVPKPLVTSVDLARMNRLNHCLVWWPERTAAGQPLTVKLVAETLGNKAGDGQWLYRIDRYAPEHFFTSQTPRGGWYEMGLAPIPGSFSLSFCGQLRCLLEFARTQVWPEGLPEDVAVAIAEFETVENDLLLLEQKDWEEAARRGSNLKLAQLLLPTPVEQLLLKPIHLHVNRTRFLETVRARTGTLSSNGKLVYSGFFDRYGASVDDWRPNEACGDLGVVFSRCLKS